MRLPPGIPDDLAADVLALIEAARAALGAEWAWRRRVGQLALQRLRAIALWGFVALALIVLALFGLITGLLLALAASLGPWLALLIVMVAIGGSVAVAAFRVRRLWRDLGAVLGAGAPPPDGPSS